jgi:hypothetical protein
MGRTVPSYRIAVEWERTNGKYSERNWTRRTESYLIKCLTIHDFITLQVVMLADLN